MADDLKWSEVPGCLERRLQQRHLNPLFPRARRHITAEELNSAKFMDVIDGKQLLIAFISLRGLEQLPEGTTTKDLMEWRDRIENLLDRCREVGGPDAQRVSRALQTLRTSIIDSVRQSLATNPEGTEALRKAEALYHKVINRLDDEFISQACRKDAPLEGADFISFLLSEPLEVIESALARLFPNSEVLFKVEGGNIAQRLNDEHKAIGHHLQKLKALGISPTGS